MTDSKNTTTVTLDSISVGDMIRDFLGPHKVTKVMQHGQWSDHITIHLIGLDGDFKEIVHTLTMHRKSPIELYSMT